jgi:tetratricopeptide (TPR) repeat protein
MADVQALMQRVDQAIAAADYDAAEHDLAEILREDPDNVDARHGMALAFYHRRDYAAAEGWIDAAIARAPDNPILFSTRGSLLMALDRLDDAARCFETVARLAPSAVDALCNLGVVREKQGRLSDAVAVYRLALERRPDYAIAAFNLGVVLQELGQIEAAAGAYRQALAIAPTMADASFNLGTLHERQGALDQAFAEYERTVTIRPNFPAAFYNMGVVRERQGRAEEAAALYQQAGRDPVLAASAAFNLGCLRRGQARNEEAGAAFHDALAAAPGWAEARLNLERLQLIELGATPYERLADDKLIDAYRYAIRAAVTPDSSVLVLEAGLGLLPMMAAQAGARSVVACESNPALAAAARDIITANGFAGRIHLVAKPSHMLVLGHDLPEPADVVIIGWFPEDPLGNELAEQLDHVRSALLAPGGLVMPGSITLHAALVEAPDIRRRFPAGMVHGFDLGLLNANRASLVQPVDLTQLNHRALSQPAAILSLALDQPLPAPSSRAVRITATASGTIHGVVSWFDLDLVGGITLSSGELRPHNAWRQLAHFLPLDIAVEAGDKLLLTVSQGRHTVGFPRVEHEERGHG